MHFGEVGAVAAKQMPGMRFFELNLDAALDLANGPDAADLGDENANDRFGFRIYFKIDRGLEPSEADQDIRKSFGARILRVEADVPAIIKFNIEAFDRDHAAFRTTASIGDADGTRNNGVGIRHGVTSVSPTIRQCLLARFCLFPPEVLVNLPRSG
jgi:hypothetical protein